MSTRVRATYPTLRFVPSSGGWTAEQGDVAAAGSTSASALYHLAQKLGDPGYRTPDDLCLYCDGAGDFLISVNDTGSGWSMRMTHHLHPLRVECSACEGTGYSADSREQAAEADREVSRDREWAA